MQRTIDVNVEQLSDFRSISFDLETITGEAWSKLDALLAANPTMMFDPMTMVALNGKLRLVNLLRYAVYMSDIVLFDKLAVCASRNNLLDVFLQIMLHEKDYLNLADYIACSRLLLDTKTSSQLDNEKALWQMQQRLPMHLLWDLTARKSETWTKRAARKTLPLALPAKNAFDNSANKIQAYLGKDGSKKLITLNEVLSLRGEEHESCLLIRGDKSDKPVLISSSTLHSRKGLAKRFQLDTEILSRLLEIRSTQMAVRMSSMQLTESGKQSLRDLQPSRQNMPVAMRRPEEPVARVAPVGRVVRVAQVAPVPRVAPIAPIARVDRVAPVAQLAPVAQVPIVPGEKFRSINYDIESINDLAWYSLDKLLESNPSLMFGPMQMNLLNGRKKRTNLVAYAVYMKDDVLFQKLSTCAARNNLLETFVHVMLLEKESLNLNDYLACCHLLLDPRISDQLENQKALMRMQQRLPMHLLWDITERQSEIWSWRLMKGWREGLPCKTEFDIHENLIRSYISEDGTRSTVTLDDVVDLWDEESGLYMLIHGDKTDKPVFIRSSMLHLHEDFAQRLQFDTEILPWLLKIRANKIATSMASIQSIANRPKNQLVPRQPTLVKPVEMRQPEVPVAVRSGANEYTASMNNYIASFVTKRRFSEIINEMDLTDQEEIEFSDYNDPISLEVMDIPVSVNGTVYNLATILTIFKRDANGVFTQTPHNEQFTLNQIQPAREKLGQIEKAVSELKARRAAVAKSQHVEPIRTASGSPRAASATPGTLFNTVAAARPEVRDPANRTYGQFAAWLANAGNK